MIRHQGGQGSKRTAQAPGEGGGRETTCVGAWGGRKNQPPTYHKKGGGGGGDKGLQIKRSPKKSLNYGIT